MSKHTPGPWEFEPSTPEDGVRCIFIFGEKNAEGYRPEIGAVYGPQDAKAFADARLMASSPKLLGALRMWMDIHQTAAGFSGKYGTELDKAIAAQQLRVDAAVSASLEAIAKATGEHHDN